MKICFFKTFLNGVILVQLLFTFNGCGANKAGEGDFDTDSLLENDEMFQFIETNDSSEFDQYNEINEINEIDGNTGCTPGQSRCGIDGIRETCQNDGKWEDNPCPTETACAGDGECLPIVCQRGEFRCNPENLNQIEICNETQTGWTLSVECPQDTVCEDGVCVPMTCEPGTTICTAAGKIRTCTESGSGYGAPQDCDEGFVCDPSGSQCVSIVCNPGSSSCLDMTRRKICNFFGSGYDTEDCPEGTSCSEGSCLERICEPLSRECDPANPLAWRQCNATGTGWGPSNVCPDGQGCSDGYCVRQICTPGTTICAPGGLIRTCNDSGTSWNDPIPCPSGQICDEGRCTDIICTPGTSTCIDQLTESVCNDTGTGYIEETCPSGYICDSTYCRLQICIPGMTQCTGTMTREMCNSTGTDWIPATSCTGRETCRNGDCLTPCQVADLTPSSIGCTFYAVDQHNRYDTANYYIVVANTHDSWTANVRLQHRRGGSWTTVATATVAPNSLYTFSPGNSSQVAGEATALGQGYAFKITSDLPLIAYQLNAIGYCTGEGSMLVPFNGLDNSYYIITYRGYSGRPLMSLIGAVDGTTVQITPSQNTLGGGPIPAITAGNTATITLNECDVAQILAANIDGDLSGTRIVASNPIAVFTGTYCSHVPQGCTFCHVSDCQSCDPLEEELIPKSTWGRTYVAAVSPEFNWGYFRIVAEQNGTVVNITPSASTTARYPAGIVPPINLNSMQMTEFELGCTTGSGGCGIALIESNKPITLVNFIEGGECRTQRCERDHCPGNYADPSMIIVPPVEQFLSEYIFLTPNGFTNNYVTVIRQVGSTTTLDSHTVTATFLPVPGARFEVGHIPVTATTHQISSSVPFGIILEGYGYANSYGYPGGINLARINE